MENDGATTAGERHSADSVAERCGAPGKSRTESANGPQALTPRQQRLREASLLRSSGDLFGIDHGGGDHGAGGCSRTVIPDEAAASGSSEGTPSTASAPAEYPSACARLLAQ